MSNVSSWTTVSFGEIAEQIIERIDNPKDSELVDYIGLEHIDSDNLRIANYGKTSEVVSSKFVCKQGDIVFGRRRAYLRKLAVSDRDALVSTDAMVIRPKNNVSKEFLILTMQTDRFWSEVISRSAGSLSPRIKWRDLSSIEVLLPSSQKQEEIVRLIFSIQGNLEKTENFIQIAEKLKKGLLEELLTKGIGHKKFKKTELGEIPEEWELRKIKDILTLQYGQGLPEKERNGGQYPVVGSNGIVGYHDAFTVKGPSIVVGRKGASGEVIWIENDCWPIDTSYFVQLKDGIRVDYAFHLLNSLNLIELSQKGAVPGLNREDVYQQLVAIPPLDEQKMTVLMIDKENQFGLALKDHLSTMKALRKKLTNSLLSGELAIPMEALN